MKTTYPAFLLTFVLAACATPSAPHADATAQSAGGIAVLTAKPQKTVCAPSGVVVNGTSIRAELCVTQGNFASDRYALKMNDTAILQGIDDETTVGISSIYRGKPIRLQCAPQNIRGNATAEDVRKIIPAYSEDKVNRTVELMKGSVMPVEVGRLCTVTSATETVMKVQVFLE